MLSGLLVWQRFIFLFVFLLCACSPEHSEQTLLEDYPARLARVLDTERVALESQTIQPYPKRRVLTVPLAETQIDILDFLRLSPCPLQRLIGERNGSLGQVKTPSQQWLYEAQFITQGRECLVHLLRDPEHTELTTVLQTALAVKQGERGAVVWNALFASTEFKHLFSLANHGIGLGEASPGELVAALRDLSWQLERWQQADIPPTGAIEQAFQVIGADNWMGRLQHSLVLFNSTIGAANTEFEARLSGRPICFNGQSNRAGDQLNQFFLSYYIGRVQPLAAQVFQQGEAVLTQIERLRGQSDLVQPEFIQYWQVNFARDNPESHWSRFGRLLSEHTSHWQKQLAQCGLLPGS